ncbi:MAG: aromatic amino acid aminotransferase [Epulopiscium sp. Nele67-Bin005]|nr:MAG: aromatic amino acid aminotransferase [Epulopiscium sp. Nele67-Bin005]
MSLENKIAKKVRDIPPSGIRKFFDVVSEMEGAISLGVGEPDFDTPWHIREEGIYSLEQGKTIYSANAGMPNLRKEVSNYMNRKFNLDYEPLTQTLVTVGGSEGIDIALRTLLEYGEEVLIPEPSFVAYMPCTIFAGGVPIAIDTNEEHNFKLQPEQLEAAITPKSKILILPYPNNPTGAIMTKEDLEKLIPIIKKHDLIVLSDEIYAELTYGKTHISIANLEDMYERTVILSGFSKAYAMTGWRLGYAVGPEVIISAMTKMHQYVLMCAPTTSQYAGIEALKNGDNDVLEMRNAYDARRKIMVNGFRKMGLSCFEPEGAFYVFPSIQKTGLSSVEFCEKLLMEEKVAVVPGNAFGESGEGFIRCSYAYSIEEIKEALVRIEKFVKKYI